MAITTLTRGSPDLGQWVPGEYTAAGGWLEDPAIALHYATPSHSWMFERTREQPVPVLEFGVIHMTWGKWSNSHWWPTWLCKEIRDARCGRRDGEIMGEPKRGTMGSKRQRTTPASDSEVPEHVASRDNDDTDRSIDSTKTATEEVQGDPVPVDDDEQRGSRDRCDVCQAVLLVGGNGNVEPHQQPKLNAAPLSLVQGVTDVAGEDGMRASRLLEALET